MRNFLRILLASALLAGAGCRTAPPAAVVSTEMGQVRAATPLRAEAVATQLDAYAPRVHAALPGTSERTVEIWVQEELQVYRGFAFPRHIAGMADFQNGRIHLRDGDERVDLHLVHELVHVLAGSEWKALPGILEEGLCDLVAVRLVPALGREQNVKRLVEASALFGGLRAAIHLRGPDGGETYTADVRLTLDNARPIALTTALELTPDDVFGRATGDDGVGLYGAGYLLASRVVERSGFDGLFALCRRARDAGFAQVPPEWAMEAAGLDDHADAVRDAVQERIGRGEVAAIGDLMAEDLAATVVLLGRPLYPGLTATEFLARAEPAFSVPHAAARLSLDKSAAFRRAVASRW